MSELMQLDLFGGRANRDAGMATAIEHADKVNEEWSEKAYAFLLKYLQAHDGLFMAEDVRKAADLAGLPVPPSERAWGAIIVRAVKSGKIKRKGYAQVKNQKAHCTPAAVWVKA